MTKPINLDTTHPVFRRAPRLILLMGYGLGLLVLAGAASTYFIETAVTVKSSGTLQAHIVPITLAEPALIISRTAHAGQTIKPGASIVEYSTSTQEIAQANLSLQIHNSLELLDSRTEADAALEQTLREALTLMATSATRNQVRSTTQGWLMGEAALTSAPVIITAGTPIAEVATVDPLRLRVSVSSERFPGVRPGEGLKILLADFASQDAIGILEKIEVSTTLEIPVGQFSEQELGRLEEKTSVSLDLQTPPVTAEIKKSPQNITFVLPLDPIDAAARHGIQSRRTAHLILPQLGGKRLSTKWGALSSNLVIRFSPTSIPERALVAMTDQLQSGQRELAIDACWIQIDTRRLLFRLFGS